MFGNPRRRADMFIQFLPSGVDGPDAVTCLMRVGFARESDDLGARRKRRHDKKVEGPLRHQGVFEADTPLRWKERHFLGCCRNERLRVRKRVDNVLSVSSELVEDVSHLADWKSIDGRVAYFRIWLSPVLSDAEFSRLIIKNFVKRPGNDDVEIEK